MASVYVHFPWCLAKCPYCDFVSFATPREAIDHEGYADAVVRELDLRLSAGWAESSITSVFFGGGTPSLWEPRALGRVLDRILQRCHPAEGAALEITVECNPTSLDEARARALADVGVNRLSIGTQSLRSESLRTLGRLHDPEGARRAIRAALGVRGLRVSTDLIFGLPGQTPDDAADQAAELRELGLDHLSSYQLTIEPGTQFGQLAKIGKLPLADEGQVADAFLAIHERLASLGLRHYEISNYAAVGQEARHNLGYWRGEAYLGLGCAAYGFRKRAPAANGAARGERSRNPIDPARYVRATQSGSVEALTSTTEELDGAALLRERIMLGLRLAEGLDLREVGRDLGVDPWTEERARAVDRLVERKRIVRDGEHLAIPPEAWLFTDDTAARLF